MYFVYHIPERRKIGVSMNLSARMKRHEWTGHYDILAETTDPQEAGDLEWKFQEQFGYPKDKFHYTTSLAASIKGAASPRGSRTMTEKALSQLASVRDPQKAADARKRINCIHCGQEGLTGNINRWHNDNCKYKST